MLTEMRSLAAQLADAVNVPRAPPPLPPPDKLPEEAQEARATPASGQKLLASAFAQHALQQEALLRRMEASVTALADGKERNSKQMSRLTALHKELKAEMKKACPPQGASEGADSKAAEATSAAGGEAATGAGGASGGAGGSAPPTGASGAGGGKATEGASGADGGKATEGASKKIDEATLAAAAANALAGARARDGAPAPAPALVVAKGALIQVSSETVCAAQAGEVGTCVSVDLKAGSVCYTPFGSKTGLDKRNASMRDIVVRRALPPARAHEKRSVGYLSTEKVKLWLANWLCTAIPRDPVDRSTQLDYSELDAGAFEVLWRVLPPKTVYVRPFVTRFISMGSSAEQGWKEFRQEALDLLARAEVAFVPIYAMGPGHWTLLVLEREGSNVQEPVLHAAAPSAAGSARAKDPRKAQEQVDREQETMLILQQANRPVLPPAAGWRARYYETLIACHMSAWNVGLNFLKKMDLAVTMPAPEARTNKRFQEGSDCGYWVLHYIEDEARAKRGEGAFTMRYDITSRVSVLTTMLAKLKKQQELDKKAIKEAKPAKAKAPAKAPAAPGS